MARAAYRRILLKLSGEALRGERQFGFDPTVLNLIAHQIRQVLSMDVQVALVAVGSDVDTPQDLLRLQDELAAYPPDAGQRTRQFLSKA